MNLRNMISRSVEFPRPKTQCLPVYQTLFIESWCDDYRIIEENVRRVKISSPDVSVSCGFVFASTDTNCRQYVGWSSEDAVKHYLARISARIPQFHTMEEKDLNYIKVWTL